MKWRVFLVEDHELVREGYAMLLGLEPDLEVSGMAVDGETALTELAEKGVDVVLVDLSLPGMSGLDFVEQLRSLHPSLPVILVTGHDPASFRRRAEQVGVQAFVAKQDVPDTLVGAIHRVLHPAAPTA